MAACPFVTAHLAPRHAVQHGRSDRWWDESWYFLALPWPKTKLGLSSIDLAMTCIDVAHTNCPGTSNRLIASSAMLATPWLRSAQASMIRRKTLVKRRRTKQKDHQSKHWWRRNSCNQNMSKPFGPSQDTSIVWATCTLVTSDFVSKIELDVFGIQMCFASEWPVPKKWPIYEIPARIPTKRIVEH